MGFNFKIKSELIVDLYKEHGKKTVNKIYLGKFPSPPIIVAPLCIVALTAVNRHTPQQTCPHGVSVAFVGGEKQIGQV